MLFKNSVLKAIVAGEIALAFRRWARPPVRAGGSLRTAVGVLAIDKVTTVRMEDISDEDAARAGHDTREALLVALRNTPDGTLYQVEFHLSGPDPREALRLNDQLDGHDLARLRHRLSALDRNSEWTMTALRLIGERDGRTAGEIAESLKVDKPTMKRRIRQLKELGLTESLQSGYRLSARGRTAVAKLSQTS